MIKYKFKYKGKLYRVIIRDLKHGVISARRDKKGQIFLIISKSLKGIEGQRELHRLIKNKGLLRV